MLRWRDITPGTECCANCVHFYQHYLADGYMVCCGHCAEPRIKIKAPWEVCERFRRREHAV